MNPEEKIATLKKLIKDPFAGNGLTDKQAEAARLIAFGYSWKEAGKELEITHQSLGDRLKAACEKLGIESPKMLTREFMRLHSAILDVGDHV